MRHALVTLLFVSALAGAAEPAQGRWEGTIHVPGREIAIVVDLARDDTAWIGSIVSAGLGLAGAPLANVAVAGHDVSFDLGAALRGRDDPPARLRARIDSDAAMIGDFTQGGNVAKVDLVRVGDARVEREPQSSRVRRALEGEWIGDFELGGYPRHVTLALDNAAGASTAKLVVVGKRTTDLPVDLVTDEGDFLRVESRASRVSFEGRVIETPAEIRGTIEVGPYEVPLVLRRAERRSP